MLIHCTMEELVAVRSGEGSPGAIDHLDSCQECRDELDRLHQRVAGLKAMPAPKPPRDRWGEVRRQIAAERRRRWQRRFGVGTAAAAALVALGLGLPSVVPTLLHQESPVEAHYAALLEESESLETALRRLEPETRVLDGRSAVAVVALEDRLMLIDARLAEARQTRQSMDDLIRLMRHRVELMEGLVGVHTTRSTYVGF